ncbi:hypothetical protein ACT3S7_03120 [Corynebacterium sp. AOP34-AQ2-28]|uniref:hypothetical protein n=1 Tax=unclassified Corynebacterium TaxID=2624378 RepID=UPI00264FF7F2|nr:hypothetical protein [Corynebacterium sp.]
MDATQLDVDRILRRLRDNTSLAVSPVEGTGQPSVPDPVAQERLKAVDDLRAIHFSSPRPLPI